MKRCAVILLGILVLVLSPAVAPAQGFLGGGLPSLPGLPSFGNMFGGGGACDPCADPGPFSLAGTVAWNYQTVDLDFRTLAFNMAGAGLGAFKHRYRFNGLQLGVSAVAVSRNGFGVWGNFNILATGSTKDPEDYNEGLGAGFFQGTRHWHAKNDNYSFTGLGFYKLFRSVAAMGGFRWDHLETTFDRPSWSPGIWSLAGDEATLTVNVFQPFVGVMVDQGGPSKVLRVGVIAWPQLYGSADYGQTFGDYGPGGPAARLDGMSAKVNEGYFWEMFGEYGLKNRMLMGAAVSVFGAWTQYHLKGTFDLDVNQAGFGNVGSDYLNISMHRNSWTAGVKIDIPLALPVPFNF